MNEGQKYMELTCDVAESDCGRQGLHDLPELVGVKSSERLFTGLRLMTAGDLSPMPNLFRLLTALLLAGESLKK